MDLCLPSIYLVVLTRLFKNKYCCVLETYLLSLLILNKLNDSYLYTHNLPQIQVCQTQCYGVTASWDQELGDPACAPSSQKQAIESCEIFCRETWNSKSKGTIVLGRVQKTLIWYLVNVTYRRNVFDLHVIHWTKGNEH